MEALYITLGAIGVVLLALILVIVIRTLTFKPKRVPLEIETDTDFDAERATECLRTLVKFKTISHSDPSLDDEAEFEGLISSLPSLYPHVFEKCEFIRLPNRAILFKLPRSRGLDTQNPSLCSGNSLDAHEAGANPVSSVESEGDEAVVLMAHFDVVGVDESGWEKPPFEGIIEDGVLWGRGTLDTKVTMNGALFATDTLIARGFEPSRDIYLAFAGNEETNGLGAPEIVKYFKSNGIKIGLVLDEGGAVCENVFPGVKCACGMIGIAEKGMLNVEYRLKSNGGHASSPKPRSLIGRLSDACTSIEKHPFKMKMSDPAYQMFNTLGRRSTPLYRTIFANLWAFSGIISLIGKKSGGEINALIRTTVAFTQANGSDAPNVMPTEASMVSNIRLNPGDTVDSALAYLRRQIHDDEIEIVPLYASNPSRISRTDCHEYEMVANAISATWQGCIVTPYLMMQCSDSRHYGELSDKVYRFSAMDLTLEERRSIHAHNEKIRLESIAKSCEFYINLIKQL